jgi:hypothetical protein
LDRSLKPHSPALFFGSAFAQLSVLLPPAGADHFFIVK